MNRNVVIAIGAVGVVALIGAGLFFLSSTGSIAPDGQPSIFGRLPIIGGRLGMTTPLEEKQQPAAPDKNLLSAGEIRQLYQITDAPVVGPVFDTGRQKVLYYRRDNGHLAANSPAGGAEETISNLTILNILEVLWSPDRKRAVITYQDGETLKKFVTEATSTPKVSFLPTEASSITWGLDGSKALWWLGQQNNVYTLISADAEGKNQRRRAFSTPIPDLGLAILTPDIFGFMPKTISFFETPFFVFNAPLASLNVTLQQFGLSVISDSDPKTQMIAYSHTTRAGALENLRTVDVKTGKETTWPIKTLAEKCVFTKNGKTLFCAVPKNLPAQNLPEAWFQGKILFSDSFFKIKLAEERVEEIFKDGDLDAIELAVSDGQERLFFVDKKNGTLYGLALE